MDDAKRKQIIDLLRTAYGMELETTINYVANSIHLDGIRAKHIKDALAADINEELMHAQQLGNRIKVLEGAVPGSMGLKFAQAKMQPPDDPLDVRSIVVGVIEAEEAAVNQYQDIIEAADVVDPVTQDMCVTLKGDEEEHRRLFKGFLAELDAGM
ncbi:MAG: rubrerythrin [Phycisphaerae bacterium]|jgi:bacterioferritin|nr:rubrerythrin [Phycisphaerae bacterium]MDP6153289.1 ferritin-like domain-containing protein [Phycisphaeraceae bacterium]MDP7348098.1 ferritin-like domain-containing protein [Phycisphaeraceae bacterium]